MQAAIVYHHMNGLRNLTVLMIVVLQAIRKLREIGPEEVNKHKISITFSCVGLHET